MTNSYLKNIASVVILILTLTACGGQQKHIDKTTFTRMYKDSLESKLPHVTFEIQGDLEIKTVSEEEEGMIYLDNAYRAYRHDPASIGSVISQYLNASVSTLNPKTHIERELIVPVIKSYKYLEDLQEVGKDGQSWNDLIYYEPYNKELIIVYAEDTEYNIRYLKRSDIDTLKIGIDTLQKFAFNNLRKLLPEVEIAGGNGLFSITAGATYETSFILSKTMWNKTNFPVDGDIVIAIPARDLVYVTGSNNKELIEKLKTFANEDFKEQNYQVSPFLFIYDGKKFERFVD